MQLLFSCRNSRVAHAFSEIGNVEVRRANRFNGKIEKEKSLVGEGLYVYGAIEREISKKSAALYW